MCNSSPAAVAILIVALQIGVTLSEDYCNPALCKKNTITTHVACGQTKDFVDPCVEAKRISLTPAIKQAILDRHNFHRNKQALGEVSDMNNKKYRKATKMMKLQWDDTLADLADYNSRTCNFAHDCHNTLYFPYSGQNLANSDSTTATLFDDDPIPHVIKFIDGWFDENVNYADKDVPVLIPTTGAQSGHFTELMQDQNTKVGCSYAMWKTVDPAFPYHIHLACNYDFTNMLGKPIYASGKPCSACPKGFKCCAEYPGLCSDQKPCKAGTPRRPWRADAVLAGACAALHFVWRATRA